MLHTLGVVSLQAYYKGGADPPDARIQPVSIPAGVKMKRVGNVTNIVEAIDVRMFPTHSAWKVQHSRMTL